MANWGVDLVNSLRNKTAKAPLPPFIIHLKLDEGMLIDEVEHGRVVQNWTPGPHFAMPDGFVQGGLFGTIADISQGVAMLTTQDQFENWATLDFHIRFMRLVRVGEVVRIESTVVKEQK
jgi:acyl-coenzyme A thioesterase PaaI-like protein